MMQCFPTSTIECLILPAFLLTAQEFFTTWMETRLMFRERFHARKHISPRIYIDGFYIETSRPKRLRKPSKLLLASYKRRFKETNIIAKKVLRSIILKAIHIAQKMFLVYTQRLAVFCRVII